MKYENKNAAIHPRGTPKDNQGMPADYDLRETPKNWGKRRIVGCIRNGVYIDTETGKPKDLSDKKVTTTKVLINKIGGIE